MAVNPMGGIYLPDSNTADRRGQWSKRAKRLKSEVVALYFAYRDPRVPWYAKLFIIIVVGYAFSPIDLIPDFIPVLGYLDDFILIPIGVAIAIKMIPPLVMDEAREKSLSLASKPRSWLGGIVIIGIWLLILVWLFSLLT